MLSPEELERYARLYIVLREVGGPGQAALKDASVLVIGAGASAHPALMYLAAAGVGHARRRSMTTSSRCPISSVRSFTPRRTSAGARSTVPPGKFMRSSPRQVCGARHPARCRQRDVTDR